MALADLAGAEEAASEVGSGAFGIEADVGSPSVRESVALAIEQLECLDVLVNNAGNMRIATAEAFPGDAWDSVASVHLVRAFRCSQAALPALRQSARRDRQHGVDLRSPGHARSARLRGGKVRDRVTDTDARDRVGAPRHSRQRGGTGSTMTPMVEDAIADGQMPAEEFDRWRRRIPLEHRLARPEEIAAAIMFLASRTPATSRARCWSQTAA